MLSVPLVGSINYFKNGSGDGVIIFAFVAIAVALTMFRRYRFLLIPGLLSLGVIGYDLADTQHMVTNAGPFLANTIQLQWGWGVLILGAVVLLAAPFVPSR